MRQDTSLQHELYYFNNEDTLEFKFRRFVKNSSAGQTCRGSFIEKIIDRDGQAYSFTMQQTPGFVELAKGIKYLINIDFVKSKRGVNYLDAYSTIKIDKKSSPVQLVIHETAKQYKSDNNETQNFNFSQHYIMQLNLKKSTLVEKVRDLFHSIIEKEAETSLKNVHACGI